MPWLNGWRMGVALGLLAGLLAGCSGSSSLSNFAFGKAPEVPKTDPNLYPAKYRTEIADFMRTWLNNPTKVKDAYVSELAMRPVGGATHYIACVRYNARDTKDQYMGSQQNLAIFLGGQLTQFLPNDAQLCAGLAYQRYPELESMVP